MPEAAPAPPAASAEGAKPPVPPPGAPESESIAVFARLKPVGPSDTRGEVDVPTRFGKQKAVQVRNLEFNLDWIFTDTNTQENLYNIAAHDRVAAVLAGYNATILAYGQTGAGKTHTMVRSCSSKGPPGRAGRWRACLSPCSSADTRASVLCPSCPGSSGRTRC